MASQTLVVLNTDIAFRAALLTGDIFTDIISILCLCSCIHTALVPARLGRVLLLRFMLLVALVTSHKTLLLATPTVQRARPI